MKQPVFSIYQDKAGEWRFRLVAKNGEIIATGEGYATKQGCIDGVEGVKRNAAKAIITTENEIISRGSNSFFGNVKDFVNKLLTKIKK
ncbi:MAG: YegP family protein [Halanaerobiales bacterium]